MFSELINILPRLLVQASRVITLQLSASGAERRGQLWCGATGREGGQLTKHNKHCYCSHLSPQLISRCRVTLSGLQSCRAAGLQGGGLGSCWLVVINDNDKTLTSAHQPCSTVTTIRSWVCILIKEAIFRLLRLTGAISQTEASNFHFVLRETEGGLWSGGEICRELLSLVIPLNCG